MGAKFIGAHMPTAGGLDNAIRNGAAIGCTAIQVFTSSPQQWKATEVTSERIEKFRCALKECSIDASKVISHDSYLINLAAPHEGLRLKSRDGLLGELRRCDAYGIPFVVSHIGAHVGLGEAEGIKRAGEMLREILKETPTGLTILMENTAGQGTALNTRFESLAKLLEICKGHKQLGVCLDTCHLFAAGYDIRTKPTYESTFRDFGKAVGFDRLFAIHANDSKKGLGDRVDRHENIGEGEIGIEAFRLLVNDRRLAAIPIVVETPDAAVNHARNVATLWSLIRKPS